MEGEATFCIPCLWAFPYLRKMLRQNPALGCLRLEQPTLPGGWWNTKCVLGVSQEPGAQGLRSESRFELWLALCLSTHRPPL